LFYWGGFRGFSNLLRFIKGLCQNSRCLAFVWCLVILDTIVVYLCPYGCCQDNTQIFSHYLAMCISLVQMMNKWMEYMECHLSMELNITVGPAKMWIKLFWFYLFIWEIPYRTERSLQILKSCYDGKHLCTCVVISSKSKISLVYIFISFVAYTFTCYIFPQQIFMLHSIFKCYEHK